MKNEEQLEQELICVYENILSEFHEALKDKIIVLKEITEIMDSISLIESRLEQLKCEEDV